MWDARRLWGCPRCGEGCLGILEGVLQALYRLSFILKWIKMDFCPWGVLDAWGMSYMVSYVFHKWLLHVETRLKHLGVLDVCGLPWALNYLLISFDGATIKIGRSVKHKSCGKCCLVFEASDLRQPKHNKFEIWLKTLEHGQLSNNIFLHNFV